MTRTERSTSPRALRHDRSENKDGVDTSMRKGGAGAHNWGSLDEEARAEREGLEDEQFDMKAAIDDGDGISPKVNASIEGQGPASRSVHVRTIDESERHKALETRQSALKKGGVDLGDIARSSAAVSGSPTNYNVNQ